MIRILASDLDKMQQSKLATLENLARANLRPATQHWTHTLHPMPQRPRRQSTDNQDAPLCDVHASYAFRLRCTSERMQKSWPPACCFTCWDSDSSARGCLCATARGRARGCVCAANPRACNREPWSSGLAFFETGRRAPLSILAFFLAGDWAPHPILRFFLAGDWAPHPRRTL